MTSPGRAVVLAAGARTRAVEPLQRDGPVACQCGHWQRPWTLLTPKLWVLIQYPESESESDSGSESEVLHPPGLQCYSA